MISQVKIILAQKLDGALANLRNAEAKLEAHVTQDYEAVKTELEACKTHFEEEINSLYERLGADFTEFFTKHAISGVSAVQIVTHLENQKAQDA